MISILLPARNSRATAEAVARIQLLLLAPLTLILVGAAATRGGFWVVLVAPAGLLLAAHARLMACVGLRSWGSAAANTAVVLAGLALAAFALGPALGLYRTVTVLSGSMHPVFDAGDMIVVTPQPARTLRLGEVITYQVPVGNEQVETHRVVRILQRGTEPIVVTKGDGNRTPDPWQAKLHGGTVWRFWFRIPLLGYALVALRSSLLHRLLVLALPALLATSGLLRIWLPRRIPHPPHAQTNP